MKDQLISIRVDDLRAVFKAHGATPTVDGWKRFYRDVHAKAVATADDGTQNEDLPEGVR